MAVVVVVVRPKTVLCECVIITAVFGGASPAWDGEGLHAASSQHTLTVRQLYPPLQSPHNATGPEDLI